MAQTLEDLFYQRHQGGLLPEDKARQLRQQQQREIPKGEAEEPKESERERDVVFQVDPNPIEERPSLEGLPERKGRHYDLQFNSNHFLLTIGSAVSLIAQIPYKAGVWAFDKAEARWLDPIEKTRRATAGRILEYDREDERVRTQTAAVDVLYKNQLTTDFGAVEVSFNEAVKRTGGKVRQPKASETQLTTHDIFAERARLTVERHKKPALEIIHAAESGKLPDKRTAEIGLALGAAKGKSELNIKFQENVAQVLSVSDTRKKIIQVLGAKANSPSKIPEAVYQGFPPEIANAHLKKPRFLKDLDYAQTLLSEAMETGGDLLRDPSIGPAVEILYGKERAEAIESILAADRGESGGQNQAYASRLLQTLKITREELAAVIDPRIEEIDREIQKAEGQYGHAIQFAWKVLPISSKQKLSQKVEGSEQRRMARQASANLLELATQDSPEGIDARTVLSTLTDGIDMSAEARQYIAALDDAATPGVKGKLKGKKTPEAELGLTTEEILSEKTQGLVVSIVQGGSGTRRALSVMPGLKVSGTPSPMLEELSKDANIWPPLIEAFLTEVSPDYETTRITQDLITHGGLRGASLIADSGNAEQEAVINALIFRDPKATTALREQIFASTQSRSTGKIGTKDVNEHLIEATIAAVNAETAIPPGRHGELPVDYAEAMVDHTAKMLNPGILEMAKADYEKLDAATRKQAEETSSACSGLAANLIKSIPLELGVKIAEQLMQDILSSKNPKKGLLALEAKIRDVIGAVAYHPEIKQHPEIQRETGLQIGRITRDVYNRLQNTIGELASRKERQTGQLIALVALLPNDDLPVPSGEIPLIGSDMTVSDMFDLEALTQQPHYHPEVDQLNLPGFRGLSRQRAVMALTNFLINELDLTTISDQLNLALTGEAAAFQKELNKASQTTEARRQRTQGRLGEERERSDITLGQSLTSSRLLKLEGLDLYKNLLKPLYQMAGLGLHSRPEAGETDVNQTSVIITDSRPVHPLVKALNSPEYREIFPQGYESLHAEVAKRFRADAEPISEEELETIIEQIKILKRKIGIMD